MKHMKTNGLVTRYELFIHFNILFIANNRIHGNTGRKPPQALSRDELNSAVIYQELCGNSCYYPTWSNSRSKGLRKSKTAAMQHIEKAALLGICGVL